MWCRSREWSTFGLTKTVIFAWIGFKSREHRDEVNAKVMKDPRLTGSMDPNAMPFRLQTHGLRRILVEA